MRRTATLLLTMALLATGCSEGPTSDAPEVAAAEVLAMVDAAIGARGFVDPVELPEGCRLEIEADEYGFEVEVIVCDTSSTTTTSIPAADLSTWFESPDARGVARALYDIVILQQGCTSGESLASLESLAAAAPEVVATPLTNAVADLYRMAASCGEDTTAWQQALNDALDDLDVFVAILRGSPNA